MIWPVYWFSSSHLWKGNFYLLRSDGQQLYPMTLVAHNRDVYLVGWVSRSSYYVKTYSGGCCNLADMFSHYALLICQDFALDKHVHLEVSWNKDGLLLD